MLFWIIFLINESSENFFSENLIKLNYVFSEKTLPTIQTEINAGLVTGLMQLMRHPNMGPKIHFETGWVFTNVAAESSSHTKVVVDGKVFGGG